jgi:hypothetical protein
MATIDGIEFQLTNLLPRVIKTNIRNKIPNGNRTSNTVLGLEGLRITLDGRVKTEEEYDNILKAFLSDGEKSLVTEEGYEYRVFLDKNTPRNHVLMRNYSEYYPFSFNLVSEYPYKFTSATTIRSKSITADGERWSADDSGNDISTAGHVPTIPDIKIVAGNPSAEYGHVGRTVLVNTTNSFDTFSGSYVLKYADTLDGVDGQKIHLSRVECELRDTTDNANTSVKVTYEHTGQAETMLAEWVLGTSDDSYQLHESTIDITAPVGENVTLRWYIRSTTQGYVVYARNRGYNYEFYRRIPATDVRIFNTSDTDVVMNVSNTAFKDEIIQINADNTGKIKYSDSFADNRYLDVVHEHFGVSLDGTNDTLDVATDGYVIYKIDTKYPITGIPLLTSMINTSAGTPTIQVAADNGSGEPDTWYDIDQAVVSGAATEYKLRSVANDFKFKGKTIIFVKFSFSGASGSISSIDFDIDMWTIDAAKPVIDTDGANEFSIMFGDASTNECTVDLIYPDRKYVA